MQSYKAPNETIYGINSKDERVFFGDVRTLLQEENTEELLDLLKIRTQIFYLNQTQPLVDNKSAFPLMIMFNFMVKMMSKVFYGQEEIRVGFTEVLKKVDSFFTEELDTKTIQDLHKVWSELDYSQVNTFADLYYAFYEQEQKGYVLDYGEELTIEMWKDSGFLVINPGWLWGRFVEYLNYQFDAPSKEEKESCLKFITKSVS